MKKRFLSLITIFIAVFLCITACKVSVNTPEPEQPAATPAPATKPVPTPAPNPDPEVSYELKTGRGINALIRGKAFLPSSQPPSDNISEINYLDIEEKNVPVWYDSTTDTTYYYANGVTTPGAVGRLMMNKYSSYMFDHQFTMEHIDISFFDSSNVTNMEYMFCVCIGLKTVDVSHFNTSKVTNMCRMFENCPLLTTLDVSNFDTSNVENMDGMFKVCGATVLDVSKFNTSKVTKMGQMFQSCEGINKLDLSNWDTSKVKDMGDMFAMCPNLTTITVSEKFVTSAIENGKDEDMFKESINLVGGNGTTYSDSYTDSAYARIDAGEDNPGYFTEIRYELKNGFAINEMVHGKAFLPSTQPPSDSVNQINYLDIEEKNVPTWYDPNTYTTYYYAKGVTTPGAVGRLMMNESSHYMFYGQVNIENIEIQVFDSRNVTNMENMFGMCINLKTVDVSHFNTSKVTNMDRMFDNCNLLTVLDVSNFDTSNVETMEGMFNVCGATILDVSKFDTSKVTTMSVMFNYTGVEKLDLSNWDTGKVKDMYRMLNGCNNLTTIIVSDKFVTSALEAGNDSDMFEDCFNLVGGKNTTYDENHTDSTYARIDGGPGSATPGYFTLKESTD